MFYWARTLFRWIFTPIVAVFLLFEEWGWAPLAALMRQLARLPLWGWCESKMMQLTWFARWYPRWKARRDALLEAIRASAL